MATPPPPPSAGSSDIPEEFWTASETSRSPSGSSSPEAWGDLRETETSVAPFFRTLESLDWAAHRDLCEQILDAEKLRQRYPIGSSEDESHVPEELRRFVKTQWTTWPRRQKTVPRRREGEGGVSMAFQVRSRIDDDATKESPVKKRVYRDPEAKSEDEWEESEWGSETEVKPGVRAGSKEETVEDGSGVKSGWESESDSEADAGVEVKDEVYADSAEDSKSDTENSETSSSNFSGPAPDLPPATLEEAITAAFLRRTKQRLKETGSRHLPALDDSYAKQILSPSVNDLIAKTRRAFDAISIMRGAIVDSVTARTQEEAKWKYWALIRSERAEAADLSLTPSITSADEEEMQRETGVDFEASLLERRRQVKPFSWQEVMAAARVAGFDDEVVDRTEERLRELGLDNNDPDEIRQREWMSESVMKEIEETSEEESGAGDDDLDWMAEPEHTPIINAEGAEIQVEESESNEEEEWQAWNREGKEYLERLYNDGNLEESVQDGEDVKEDLITDEMILDSDPNNYVPTSQVEEYGMPMWMVQDREELEAAGLGETRAQLPREESDSTPPQKKRKLKRKRRKSIPQGDEADDELSDTVDEDMMDV